MESADPPATEVSKKVVSHKRAWKLLDGRIVKRCPRYSASSGFAAAVCVSEKWTAESRVACWTLGVGPAVIRTSNAVVYFLPGVLTNVVYEDPAAAGLEVKRERISETQCPDRAVVPGRGVEERIVGRNRSVGVDSQHLAQQIAKCLRV